MPYCFQLMRMSIHKQIFQQILVDPIWFYLTSKEMKTIEPSCFKEGLFYSENETIGKNKECAYNIH